MLLDGELAGRRDAGVVDLDLVGGFCRLSQRGRKRYAGQQAEMTPQAGFETPFQHYHKLSSTTESESRRR